MKNTAFLARLPAIVLTLLLAVGGMLRLDGLGEQSFYHDEIDMLLYADGLIERGTASKQVGSMDRPLATYEALVYPIALSRMLLGESEWAARLPAALFGTAAIAAVFFVGRALFSPAVGLLAAALLCFNPQALIWSKYLWHPQQAQLLALLTAYFVFRALEDRVRPVALAASAVLFSLTYLTWEGTGYLLPAFLIAVVTVRGRDPSWLKEPSVWVAGGAVALVVGFQLGRRMLLSEPFLVVGSGLSNVTTPLPVFLQSIYNPLYYFRNFLWLEDNAVLTLLMVAGIPLCWRLKAYRYVVTLLLADLFLMTNLLPRPAIRYVFHLEPLLILAASAALVQGMAWLRSHLGDAMPPAVKAVLGVSWAATCFGVLAASSPLARLHSINGFSQPTGVHVRPDTYYIDYRSPGEVLRAHLRPGDVVVSLFPDATQHYAGTRGDYFIQVLPRRPVLFDAQSGSPRLIERNIGTPTLTSLADLQEVSARSGRVWIVAVPYSLLYFYGGRSMHEWIADNARVMHESYDARLYLLER